MEWNGLEWTEMDWNGFGMDVSSLDGKVPGQILLGGRLDADLVQLCRLLTVASAFQNNKYVTDSWIFPKRIRLTNFAGSGSGSKSKSIVRSRFKSTAFFSLISC